MAGSILVRYAKKTYKQQKAEERNSAVFKNLTHSVDIIPESISIMTFNSWTAANKFAQSVKETGHHILEIKDDYRKQ